jgi:MoxR-like ATPase
MTLPLTPEYSYTGADQYHPPATGRVDRQGREYFPYLPTLSLTKAINLAMRLRRPLLLEGEPGCGKTRVAGAIAYELARRHLHGGEPDPEQEDHWWPFYIWNVTSSSRAQDGLYTYDAVGRLRDAQLMGTHPDQLKDILDPTEIKALKERLRDKGEYLKYGPLGLALTGKQYRPIMLIDEIDKADSDFPSDLLLELDELRFTIPELDNRSIPAPPDDRKPIILITSNREKPLPEPFLRRCLYYYLSFPAPENLKRIIQVRFAAHALNKAAVVEKALEKFATVRDLLTQQPGSRPPGTSELLEFLTVLLEDQRPMEEALKDLNNLAREVALLGTLIKTKAGLDLYQQQAG